MTKVEQSWGGWFGIISRSISTAFGEGGWRLTSFEMSMLDAVRSSFGQLERSRLLSQLNQKYYVDRINTRVIAVWFKYLPDEVLLPRPAFDNALYRVNFTADGEKLTSNVTFYKGHLLTIECKKPQKYFKGKVIEVTKVSEGSPKRSLTHAMDRLEHGRNEL